MSRHIPKVPKGPEWESRGAGLYGEYLYVWRGEGRSFFCGSKVGGREYHVYISTLEGDFHPTDDMINIARCAFDMVNAEEDNTCTDIYPAGSSRHLWQSIMQPGHKE